MFREKGIEFISLNDNIDTTTIHGRLIFNIFASFAEFERELISERTRVGLEAAQKKGRIGGRKPGLSKESQNKAYMAEALTETDKPVSEILQFLKISKATYYRYLEWIRENPYKGKRRSVRKIKN
jgi:DNA invertase Pin-like site-specific DNA recombinase